MMFQLLLGIFTDWLILSVLVYGAIYGIFRLLKYWFEKKQHKLRELLIHDDRLIKTDSQVWFYQRNNNSQGPVNQEKIKLLFRKGIIKSNTLLWIDGLDDWKPFSLFEYFHEIVISERVRKAYHLLLLGLLVIPLFLVGFRIFLFNLIFIVALFFFRWESYFQTSQKLSGKTKRILFSMISISIIALECVLFANMLHNRSRLLDAAYKANIRELNYRIGNDNSKTFTEKNVEQEKSTFPLNDIDARKICQSNLKQILLAMMQYSIDSDGKYPSLHDWNKVLLKDYLTDEKLLYCPADSSLYAYLGENVNSVTKLPPSKTKILRCPKHKWTGFADGHVSFSRH